MKKKKLTLYEATFGYGTRHSSSAFYYAEDEQADNFAELICDMEGLSDSIEVDVAYEWVKPTHKYVILKRLEKVKR